MTTTPTTTPDLETLFLIEDVSDRRFSNGTPQSPAARVVQRWHDVTHEGAYRFCDQQPCHAVRSVDRA